VLQLTPLIPLPFAIAVITEPVGNNSSTVAFVPDDECPAFVIVKVYVCAAPINTVAVLTVLVKTNDAGELTVIAA
jgi:hypothetical protein